MAQELKLVKTIINHLIKKDAVLNVIETVRRTHTAHTRAHAHTPKHDKRPVTHAPRMRGMRAWRLCKACGADGCAYLLPTAAVSA